MRILIRHPVAGLAEAEGEAPVDLLLSKRKVHSTFQRAQNGAHLLPISRASGAQGKFKNLGR